MKAVQAFAKPRPFGIFKEDYIRKLFMSYDDRWPPTSVLSSTSMWKRVDVNGEGRVAIVDNGSVAEVASRQLSRQTAIAVTSADVSGDSLSEDKQINLRRICYWAIGVRQFREPERFPGSQPVSLDRENLELLRRKRYSVTWKADGTRYMLLIVREGVYLIDRNFNFTPVQLRFPLKDPVVGDASTETQHYTLLDGEMVIDRDPDTGNVEQKYLVYDVMMINQKQLTKLPFHQRWRLIDEEIIYPRSQDQKRNRRYKYEAEPFKVQRKDFWQLSTVGILLNSFIPTLSHMADGLVFQGWDDVYVPWTNDGLLKWKYADMISVDFLLKVGPSGTGFLLFLRERGGGYKQLEGARVRFPEKVNTTELVGKIIECNWNKKEHVWEYMRVRNDKESPNAYHVYKKVMRSIQDNITEEILLANIAGV